MQARAVSQQHLLGRDQEPSGICAGIEQTSRKHILVLRGSECVPRFGSETGGQARPPLRTSLVEPEAPAPPSGDAFSSVRWSPSHPSAQVSLPFKMHRVSSRVLCPRHSAFRVLEAGQGWASPWGKATRPPGPHLRMSSLGPLSGLWGVNHAEEKLKGGIQERKKHQKED